MRGVEGHPTPPLGTIFVTLQSVSVTAAWGSTLHAPATVTRGDTLYPAPLFVIFTANSSTPVVVFVESLLEVAVAGLENFSIARVGAPVQVVVVVILVIIFLIYPSDISAVASSAGVHLLAPVIVIVGGKR